MKRHRWELPESASSSHQWETLDDAVFGEFDASEDDANDEVEPTAWAAERAAELFLESLLALFLTSKVSAESIGVICYHAFHAGIAQANKFAFRPGAPSGHYSRHMKDVLGFRGQRERLYQLPVTGTRKYDLGRSNYNVAVQPAHETVMRDAEQDPSLCTKLRDMLDCNALPPAYTEHVVVQQNRLGSVLPVAIYMDGVPYSNTDGVWGIWIINMVNMRRFLVGLIRKRITCRCGCKGWCTSFAVLSVLRWCLTSLAAGVYPSSRHDGTAWQTTDSMREQLAGKAMQFKAAVVYILGDWAEFCERLGFPTWQSSLRPCFCCSASGQHLYQTSGVSVLGAPWHVNTDADFADACKKCEIMVYLSKETHKQVCDALFYDKRRDGNRGRCLSIDIPGLGLKAGDRLEPSQSLPDIGRTFDECANFPVMVFFWRRSEETLCTHRCPLFDPAIGTTPNKSVALDLLHTLYLGVMVIWCQTTIWATIACNIWADCGDEVTRVQLICLRMRGELFQFYQRWKQEHRNELLTELTDFSPNMIGTSQAPKLTTKASETWGLLLFLLSFVEGHQAAFRNESISVLYDAGMQLKQIVYKLKTHDNVVVDAYFVQELLDHFKQYAAAMEPFGVHTPKVHLMMHLILRSQWFGVPTNYATWRDEGYNRLLKDILRNCPQETFETVAFFKVSETLQRRQ